MTALEQSEIERIGQAFTHAAVLHPTRWMTTSVLLESTLFLIAQGSFADPPERARETLWKAYAKAVEACDCAPSQQRAL